MGGHEGALRVGELVGKIPLSRHHQKMWEGWGFKGVVHRYTVGTVATFRQKQEKFYEKLNSSRESRQLGKSSPWRGIFGEQVHCPLFLFSSPLHGERDHRWSA